MDNPNNEPVYTWKAEIQHEPVASTSRDFRDYFRSTPIRNWCRGRNDTCRPCCSIPWQSKATTSSRYVLKANWLRILIYFNTLWMYVVSLTVSSSSLLLSGPLVTENELLIILTLSLFWFLYRLLLLSSRFKHNMNTLTECQNFQRNANAFSLGAIVDVRLGLRCYLLLELATLKNVTHHSPR